MKSLKIIFYICYLITTVQMRYLQAEVNSEGRIEPVGRKFTPAKDLAGAQSKMNNADEQLELTK